MDESRSRIPVIYPADLIIEAPRHLSRWLRIRDWLLTLGLWAIYLWLISEVFVFGWRVFNWLFHGAAEPQQLARVFALFDTLGSYVGVIAINATTLLAWALYNQYRFRGRERRKFAPHVSSEDLAQMYGFPAAVIEQWQGAPILIANLTQEGRLMGMDVLARPAPAEAISGAPEPDVTR